MNDRPTIRSSPSAYPDLAALLDTVRAAASTGSALRKSFRIHGSGSHDFYGEALEGELLETRGLSGIVQYEPSELVITVGAGTLLCDLEKHCQRKASAWRLNLRCLQPTAPTAKPPWVAWWHRV